MAYTAAMYVNIISILERGFSEKEILSSLQLFLFLLLILESFLIMVRLKCKKNLPYKLIIDSEKQIIQFYLRYNDRVKEVSFDEIEEITVFPRGSYFKFKSGKKFMWYKNSKNQSELEQLLSQSGLQITKKSAIF